MRRGLLWLALLGISRAWLRSGLAALVIAAAILAVAFFSGQIELRRADVLAGYDATGAGTLVVGLRGLDESEVDALAASIGHLEKVQSVEAPYSGIGTGVVADTSFLVFRNERQQEFLGARTSVLGVDASFDLSRDYFVNLHELNPSAPQRVLGVPLLRTAGESRPPLPGEVLIASGVADYAGVQVGSDATVELVYTGGEQPVVRHLEGLHLIGTFDPVGPDQGRFDPFWRFNSHGSDVLTVRADAGNNGTTTLPIVLNQEALQQFLKSVRQDFDKGVGMGPQPPFRDHLVIRATTLTNVPLVKAATEQLLSQRGLRSDCDKQASQSFCIILPERNNFRSALQEQTKIGIGGSYFVALLLALVASGTAGLQVQSVISHWRDYGILQAIGFLPGDLIIYSALELGLLLAGGISVSFLGALLLPSIPVPSFIIAVGAAVISAAAAGLPVLVWPLWRAPAELLRDAP
jgi:hypothetical protein